MPAHRVRKPPSWAGTSATAVARTLSGAPLRTAARDAGIAPEVLERLVSVFHDAGYQAVEEYTAHSQWLQADLAFDPHHREAAEGIAAAMDVLCARGHATRWWFLNKDPGWRLRVRMAGPEGCVRTQETLDQLVARGTVGSWSTGVYEPETGAFGGPVGMDIAHELFSADSGAITRLPPEAALPLGRKQLSLMLCTQLMHAAALEPLEHGDAWDLVCALRPLPRDVDRTRVEAMLGPVRTLLESDTGPEGAMFGADGALRGHTEWAGAFSRAGHQLAHARRSGDLRRGVRRVIAHLVIFHWNRLAVPGEVQAALARAARAVVLDTPPVGERPDLGPSGWSTHVRASPPRW